MNDSSRKKSAGAPSPSRWKRLLQNLTLSFVTFCLCIAAFEIILRMEGYGDQVIYTPDPNLFWKLEPNQDCRTKIGRKPLHINAHGTRGPDFQTQKPPNTIRILSLGDSRTFGWGLADDETYSARLQDLLQKYVGGAEHIEVINAGVDAWSYPQMETYFRTIGLKYHPDIVLLADANLWTQFSSQDSPEFVRAFMRRVRLKNFLRHFAIYDFVVEVELEKYYIRYRTKFIPVDPNQDTMFRAEQRQHPYEFFRSSIEKLCALAQENGVKPVLLYLPNVHKLDVASTPMLNVMREVQEKVGVPLVDVTPDIRPEGKALYLDADPVHFNARGNQLIALRLFEAMRSLIKP